MQGSPKTIASGFMDYLNPKGINTVNSVTDELDLLSGLIRNLRLTSYFKNPHFTDSIKEEWLIKICKSIKASDETVKVMLALLKINQLGSLNKVVSSLKELRLNKYGIGQGEVTTVSPLSADQRKEVVELIKKMSGFKEAIVAEKTNPNIIGGIILSSGDKLYDASIKRQLKNLLKIVS